jgi:glycosyltransferase 2 family protein
VKIRQLLIFIAKLLLSAALLAFIFHSIDAVMFWRAIIGVDLRLFLLSLALFFPAQLLMAHRWCWLLQAFGYRFPFQSVLRHHIRGQFAALFLPGQVSGDVVRGVSISRGSTGKTTLALSIIIDKVALLAALAMLAWLGSLWSPQLSKIPFLGLASLGLLACTLGSLWLFARFRFSPTTPLVRDLTRVLPSQIQQHASALLYETNVPILSFGIVGKAVLLACGLQIVSTLGGFFLALAMGISLNPLDWAAINAVVAVAQILPISIGGLGVREGIIVQMLSLYGVEPAQATAFSLLGFAFFVLLVSATWLAIELTGKHVRPASTIDVDGTEVSQ